MTFVVERCVANVNAAHLAVLQQALVFVYDRLTSPGEPVRWQQVGRSKAVPASPEGQLNYFPSMTNTSFIQGRVYH